MYNGCKRNQKEYKDNKTMTKRQNPHYSSLSRSFQQQTGVQVMLLSTTVKKFFF